MLSIPAKILDAKKRRKNDAVRWQNEFVSRQSENTRVTNGNLRQQSGFPLLDYDFVAVQNGLVVLHYDFAGLQNHFAALDYDFVAVQFWLSNLGLVNSLDLFRIFSI